jgi:hypothetical protein
VFNELFQETLLGMSGGLPAKCAAEEMSACLMEHAAHHGFDTLQDPSMLTRDLCAVAHTALERISRDGGLDLGRPAPRAGWKFSCLANSGGTALERWIAVESWDQTEQYGQLHSWYVYGDCCAARKPMRIRAIELGPLRSGHFHCDWARCFAHPALLNIYRFRKQDGSKLESSWKPMWLKDLREKHAKDWVDRMERDGVDRIPTLSVGQPTAADLDRFEKELEHYRTVISSLPRWQAVPMRRTSCDVPPCPGQPVCYGEPRKSVEELGGFVKIRATLGGSASV